jgi:hypothetical protein
MQRVAYLNSADNSAWIGRLFSQGDRGGIDRFLSANRATGGKEKYYLHGAFWKTPATKISASEFRHICLLFREINTYGLPKGLRDA